MTAYRDIYWSISLDPSASSQFRVNVFASSEDLFAASTHNGEFLEQGVLRPEASESSREGRDGWRDSGVSATRLRDAGMRRLSSLPAAARSSLGGSTPDQPRAIRIVADTARVQELTWEWLASPNAPLPIGLDPAFRIVRQVPHRYVSPPGRRSRALKIMLVLSNPKDEQRIVSHREIDIIASAARDQDVALCERPTFEAVAQMNAEYQPDVVHYVGHSGRSSGRGFLILHDYHGNTRWVGADELASALCPTVRLLSLSTPSTVKNYDIFGLGRFAHSPDTTKLPSVVFNQYTVEEPSIRRWWQVFYDHLTAKGNFVDAGSYASQAVAMFNPGAPDWGSFAVVARATGDHLWQAESTTTPAAEVAQQLMIQLANDLAHVSGSLSAETRPSVLESSAKYALRAQSPSLSTRKPEGEDR